MCFPPLAIAAGAINVEGSAATSGDRPARRVSYVKGGTVCPTHGGSAPQVRRAARRRIAAAEAAKRLADVEVEPVGDPLAELERLAGEALALRQFFANRVAASEEARRGDEQSMRGLDRKALGILAEAGRGGNDKEALDAVEQARSILQALVRADPSGGAELELYLEALDRSQRFLRDLASLGLDERRVRVAEKQGELLAGVVKATLKAVFALVREEIAVGELASDASSASDLRRDPRRSGPHRTAAGR